MAAIAKTIAAIDLGSNSFHLAIGQVQGDTLQIVCRYREKVQLAKYLDSNNVLSEAGISRALACLKGFRQAFLEHAPILVKVVATNTIRVAANQELILRQLRAALGLSTCVVSGEEEAALIYQGATQMLTDKHTVLVLDIGGGSTELIVGKGNNVKVLLSLPFGCVNMTQRYFAQGISARALDLLAQDVSAQLMPHLFQFRAQEWQVCLGCSGTVQSMIEVANQQRPQHNNSITAQELAMQLEDLKQSGRVEHLEGLRADRVDTYAGGLGIISTLSQLLEIKEISRSNGALREGVLAQLATHQFF